MVKFTDKSKSEIQLRTAKTGSCYMFVEDGESVWAYLLEVDATENSENKFVYTYEIGEPEKIR